MGASLRSSLWLTLILALLGATPLSAQSGVLMGRVTDSSSGEGLADARLELIDPAGLKGGSGVSGPNGQFRLTDLPGGTYTLVVTLAGYETGRLENVRVVDRQSSMVAVTLDVAAFELNPVVVSASRRQEKVLDAPASVTLIDSRSVSERPATSATDHLRSVPGVDIVSQGVQSTNVVARGFNNIFSGSLHTLTDNRIAGLPSLRVNLMQFVPSTNDDIERLEVVLGPGSALYGPNTTNGVLHIITRSPLDEQTTTASLAAGGRSLLQASARSSALLSDNFGLKVSGEYFRASEWAYRDPVEESEFAFYNDSVPGVREERHDRFKAAIGLAEDTTQATRDMIDRQISRIATRDFDLSRWSTDLRADWRVADDATVVFSGGVSQINNGIELTGLGAAQVRDWRYGYLQTRATWGRLFAQAYLNASDAGTTYLLRNGAPIRDRSRLYVAQAQHGFSLSENQQFTYGLDLIHTNPVTDGTINGIYEDDDRTTELGGYLQSETALTPRLDLVLAGRLDHHSALPEVILSPRAALVFRPTDDQAFRLTYNRAFSTPSSLDQWLDLGSVIPDSSAAALGYSLRVQGTGRDGFRFVQPNGTYLMRSPFTEPLPGGAGGPNQLVPAGGAASYWLDAVSIAEANFGGEERQLPTSVVNHLNGLAPTSADIGPSYLHPQTREVGPLSDLDLDIISAIREATTTTVEAGYKGVLGDRLLLAADLWYSRKENMVTPLTIQTPFVVLNGQETGNFLAPEMPQIIDLFQQDDPSLSLAEAQQLAEELVKELASAPIGVISSPDVNATGAQLLTTLVNVDDHFDLFGIDLAATTLLSPRWSLSGTLSLTNKNLFETRKGEQVTLNAPRTKASLALAYRNEGSGVNAELRGRFNDSFPVRSGVYNGILCLAGDSDERSKMLAQGAEGCVESSTLVDLLLGYRLPMFRNASLQFSVQNLLDSGYRSFPGVPTMGRFSVVQVKYEF